MKHKSVFPDHYGFENHANGSGVAFVTPEGGLTKRELVAAMCLQGLVTGMSVRREITDLPLLIGCAVQAADALLAELEDE